MFWLGKSPKNGRNKFKNEVRNNKTFKGYSPLVLECREAKQASGREVWEGEN